MKLSKRAQYSLYALTELAQHYPNTRPIKLHHIAEKRSLSLKYLEQIFIPLRKAGLVIGVRGPIGGYRLNHDPKTLQLKTILTLLGDSLCQDQSLDKDFPLVDQLQHTINDALDKILCSITLQDLSRAPNQPLKHA